MKNSLFLLPALLPVLSCPAMAELPECPDLAAAKKVAAEQKRDIMWLFTGNDWCPACIYLETKIMNQADFDAAVGTKLVLVKELFPRTPEALKQVTDEQMERRLRDMDSMKITALPAAVLADEKGLPYAIVPGAERDVAGYVKRLEEGMAVRAARDAAFARAEGLQGLERAKALAAALQTVSENLRGKYVDVLAEIESLDPQNTLGYNGMVQRAERQTQLKAEFRTMIEGFAGKLSPEELADCRRQIEEFMAANPDMSPEMLQACYLLISEGYALSRDFENCYLYVCKALEAAPDSPVARKTLVPSKQNFEQNILPLIRGQKAAEAPADAPAQK